MRAFPSVPALGAALLLVCSPASTARESSGFAHAATSSPFASTDITDTLQAQLDAGRRTITIPAGEYLLGPIAIPEGTHLIFDHNARVTPNIDAIKKQQPDRPRTWLTIDGDNVTIDSLTVNFTQSLPPGAGTPEVAADRATHDAVYYGVHPTDAPFAAPSLPPGTREINAEDLSRLIRAEGRQNLRILRLRALRTQPDWFIRPKKDAPAKTLGAISLENCRDVLVAECQTSHLHTLVGARNTSRLTVRDNLSTHGRTMTSVNHGNEWLLHTGNRSRYVVDQCRWWGGDSNDTQAWVPSGTASLVRRGVPPGSPDYSEHTTGVYDMSILGNQAEYGRTLAWGSKGRNVLIANNVARYMTDMAYDTEGTGRVVIANNIAINSKYFGIGCYFWGDSVVITGNLVMVEPEGDPKFQGDFLRLHSANTTGFGNRRILVTGNQFVAREGKPRVLTIEACKDVNLSGNKIVNGQIRMRDISEELTIMGNEIVNDLPGNYAAIQAAPGTKRLFIKDNILRRLYNEDDPLAGEAALSRIGGREGLRLIEGNVIEGWKYAAWTGQGNNLAATVVFRQNSATGELLTDRGLDARRLHVSGNLDLRTLEALQFRPATESERQPRPQASKRLADPLIDNAPTQ